MANQAQRQVTGERKKPQPASPGDRIHGTKPMPWPATSVGVIRMPNTNAKAKLKASHRRVYYVSKWVAIVGGLYLIFFSWLL